MFAGITQAVGTVVSASTQSRCRTVRIRTPRGWKLILGQSVMVDGICSTVEKRGADFFEVTYMPETLSRTTAPSFSKGTLLNLERSLKLSDFVDGHLVAGHVDASARIVAVKATGSSKTLTIELPKELKAYVSARGSVAINGISLTVAHKEGRMVTVALVPFTLAHTNLKGLEKGDKVNVEIDLLTRSLVSRARK
ncbi:hypothetical protein A3C20_02305 [Candidatus Kaiserbacteria bacterium RIFCSPHIGHO2_02_FULL_55_25]|uniref:Lumazine-binding domain-containing protein n=1 Tax=Candidatus Kaiserbacteria bacterium RIFCSPHIGHO2_02_FULL_55_25 TaxID=1798498 RepID=A0A1F6E4W5_9BACT|nr:MAG: hypothetical protein A2764_01485 [Candidatus Kaiserbacteria bacterium RIFCSPHIGHO2_01_FULL_55_79]OGG68729.1 MAG: hypothetical protein A3C20_02305 [Candidatus Kaiserbacteria bacterium RIFCSPHIGHO2_02_FULL_55_25]OGG77252.1 MAG: hypothetical protein A3F56_04250 [Candidatus Kaiserbacteria bacterium RIFCSPHIGHO2_12_FULL_55_13]OGG82946.1 MAG: hypothetical protein A3A42_03435 [Candidatus Kaiserbacteria bacterium RIFCSPLOWO2_01_FULL_55_25]